MYRIVNCVCWEGQKAEQIYLKTTLCFVYLFRSLSALLLLLLHLGLCNVVDIVRLLFFSVFIVVVNGADAINLNRF